MVMVVGLERKLIVSRFTRRPLSASGEFPLFCCIEEVASHLAAKPLWDSKKLDERGLRCFSGGKRAFLLGNPGHFFAVSTALLRSFTIDGRYANSSKPSHSDGFVEGLLWRAATIAGSSFLRKGNDINEFIGLIFVRMSFLSVARMIMMKWWVRGR